MTKEIIISAPENEVTGLAQRKKLTGVAINPATGYLSLSFEVQQLDAKGNPLALQSMETDQIQFHNMPGEEIPAYVTTFLNKVYTAVGTLLTAHEAAPSEPEPTEEGGEANG